MHNSQNTEAAKVPVDRWIKKWYIYTMEDCSVRKKNEIMPSAAPRMGLQIITLESRGARATGSKRKTHTSLTCGV